MASSHGVSPQWHFDVLPQATRRALETFSRATWLKGSEWYLAGGTAMALQVGHRSSVDLDFFTTQPDFSAPPLIAHFDKKQWITDIVRKGTVYGTLLGAKTSFIAYPFFVPCRPFRPHGFVKVLDLDDIAVMKIVAISQRGRKRDFVDLYWYCVNRRPLWEIIQCLPDQYPAVAHNYGHILKSLTYFADAEEDPMPKLLFRATWNGIRQFFRREVPKTAKIALGL